LGAVKNVNEILGPAVMGLDPVDQKTLGDVMIKLDGTPNRANLGVSKCSGERMKSER